MKSILSAAVVLVPALGLLTGCGRNPDQPAPAARPNIEGAKRRNDALREEGVPAVNRFCLVDTERDAVEMARAFSVSQPEPGPYCVVEVWRELSPGAEPDRA
jgi:hypothetical protein